MSRRTPAPRPIARHGRLRRSSAAKTALGVIAGALAVVLIAGVSVAAIAVTQLTASVHSDIHLVHANGATAPPGIDAISGGVNLLLVGTDTRSGQGGEFSTKDQLAGSSGRATTT